MCGSVDRVLTYFGIGYFPHWEKNLYQTWNLWSSRLEDVLLIHWGSSEQTYTHTHKQTFGHTLFNFSGQLVKLWCCWCQLVKGDVCVWLTWSFEARWLYCSPRRRSSLDHCSGYCQYTVRQAEKTLPVSEQTEGVHQSVSQVSTSRGEATRFISPQPA